MGRTRTFDAAEAVRAAGRLFARLGYEGASVDDLVSEMGIHRGSLYRVFGSKLNLFHSALRAHIDSDVLPWVNRLGDGTEGFMAAVTDQSVDLRLLLVAMLERAPTDPIAEAEIGRAWRALRTATGAATGHSAAAAAGSLGLRLAGLACLDGDEMFAAAHDMADLATRRGDPKRQQPDQEGHR